MTKVCVRLAKREREIVQQAAFGSVPKQIAFSLELSPRYVNNRIAGICRKLGVASRQELIVWVLQHPESLDGDECEVGLHPPGCRCSAPYCMAMLRRSAAHPAGCRCASPLCQRVILAA